MHLLLVVACPKTWGLDRHADLTDPHVIIPNTARVPFHNRAAIVADKEVVGTEVAVEDTQTMEKIMEPMGEQ